MNIAPHFRLAPPRRITRGVVLATALAVSLMLPAIARDFPFLGPRGAPANAFPKPDRDVADIVSPIWHDEKERDGADETGQLVRLLGIKAGMVIADIGAGSGYHTVRLSPIVGPSGRILAQDVLYKYLNGLDKRVRSLKLGNVTVSLGEPHDPRLPANTVDLAILIHMYHEIAAPFALLHNLSPALKAGARVGIVDALGETAHHGTPPELLKCELAAVGYRQIAFHPLAGDAYLAVFEIAALKPPGEIVPCKAK